MCVLAAGFVVLTDKYQAICRIFMLLQRIDNTNDPYAVHVEWKEGRLPYTVYS